MIISFLNENGRNISGNDNIQIGDLMSVYLQYSVMRGGGLQISTFEFSVVFIEQTF